MRATPAGDRHVRHIGIHLHSRHEAATETELPRNRIVVDLVLGSDRSLATLAAMLRADLRRHKMVLVLMPGAFAGKFFKVVSFGNQVCGHYFQALG